ncbi:SgcJ/EcaC family oxidoreductase [Streptomyces sp. N2-109]|uniref:SgcJ/EcaC family oxidoreductase n=1 Tax=Streptomyces gossypii TaxID=2883101 RepID=A0ABT2JPK9_9ACTN|nr:SgcJ/EcaC family oxidoreductase [Streptomyces gossypii]MCT2589691.1 SgcJ/EcaC family oxidoreductase [Streptomyces gossypii]
MNEADEREIRRTLASYTGLWVRHEMDAWGELFTEDSDFITHRGIWWTSRQENVAGHKDVPGSVLDQKENYSQEVVSIQGVTPEVALVHTAWDWPGHRLPGAETPEDRRGLITLVLVRQPTGAWLIRAAHNTRKNGLHDFAATDG